MTLITTLQDDKKVCTVTFSNNLLSRFRVLYIDSGHYLCLAICQSHFFFFHSENRIAGGKIGGLAGEIPLLKVPCLFGAPCT